MAPKILQENEVLSLRLSLRRAALDTLCAAYGTDHDKTALLRFHAHALTPSQETLARFFLLEERVDCSLLCDVVPESLVGSLLRNGLAEADAGTVCLSKLRLIYHFGAWIFCGSGRHALDSYFGNDSIALGRVLPHSRSRVLDVCSGVGTQGIAAALRGCQNVVCLEKNTLLEGLFHLNSSLNGVSDRVSWLVHDASSGLNGLGVFDEIITNPPLLPLPDEIEFPLVGHGGPDGQRIIKAILRSLGYALAEEGRFTFVTTILGDEKGPHPVFEESTTSLSMTLAVISRTKLEPGEPMFEAIVSTAAAYRAQPRLRECLTAFYKTSSASWLYFVVGSVCKVGKDTPQGVLGTRHYLLNDRAWCL